MNGGGNAVALKYIKFGVCSKLNCDKKRKTKIYKIELFEAEKLLKFYLVIENAKTIHKSWWISKFFRQAYHRHQN